MYAVTGGAWFGGQATANYVWLRYLDYNTGSPTSSDGMVPEHWLTWVRYFECPGVLSRRYQLGTSNVSRRNEVWTVFTRNSSNRRSGVAQPDGGSLTSP